MRKLFSKDFPRNTSHICVRLFGASLGLTCLLPHHHHLPLLHDGFSLHRRSILRVRQTLGHRLWWYFTRGRDDTWWCDPEEPVPPHTKSNNPLYFICQNSAISLLIVILILMTKTCPWNYKYYSNLILSKVKTEYSLWLLPGSSYQNIECRIWLWNQL